ncbi:MAG: hypothetical protein GY716_22270 [bacterium]|nr:hypothetical protein [bacterium]
MNASDRAWFAPSARIAAIGLLSALAGAVSFAGTDAVPRAIQLAGHGLVDAPHVEYVTAFNENESVEAALDLRLHPELAGATCDVWVVEAKTPAQWSADPTLQDARSECVAVDLPGVECSADGPPCRCRFRECADCDASDTTFTLAAADTLSSEAGPCLDGKGGRRCIGLGAGYDVVLDCDRDGRLGPADSIDGGGDEAGFYRVHDTTQPALPTVCVDYRVEGVPEMFRWQRTYFPSDFAGLGRLPLVVIGHGHGHSHEHYGYLQRHLASYGAVAMSHQVQTDCGTLPSDDCTNVGAASDTTLLHTEALLDLLLDASCAQHVATRSCPGTAEEAVDLCDLYGHVDPGRIALFGHSRGGAGVAWAYSRLAAGSYRPRNFTADSIALVSSMAPPDMRAGDKLVSPHDAPFHLFWGAADGDVTGKPSVPGDHSFQIFERATGPRHSTYIHGVGHGWFHDGCSSSGDPGCDFTTGPANLLIGEALAHLIVKGYALPLFKHYTEGNVPARDYLWRPWDRFRPSNPAFDPAGDRRQHVTVEYRPGDDPQLRTIEDHESNPSPLKSSSGGAVRHTLESSTVFEGAMRDGDCTFEWERPEPAPGSCGCFGNLGPCRMACDGVMLQPMNGMTRMRSEEQRRAVTFEWPVEGIDGPYSYDLAIVSPLRDFSAHEFLAFRAAQMPRHPLTLAETGDLDLTVALVDAEGTTARLRLGALGMGIPEPYARGDGKEINACTFGGTCGVALCCPEGCNPFWSRPGWQAEFQTVRLRLRDFLHDAPRLDLAHIVTIRFEVGAGRGSAYGRLALDDVELTGR